MKRILFSAAAFVTAACLFTSCKPKTERLDDIVKDLSADSYSLSFDKTYPDYGITKTSYGAESIIAYADPEDVICGEPWRIRFPKSSVPIFKIPQIVQPTCPIMIPLDIATRVEDVLTKADPVGFAGLKQLKLVDSKNVLLANEKFTGQFAALKPDMIDDSVLNGLDYNKFLLLEEPGNLSPGFTRNFYGTANIPDNATKTNTITGANTNFVKIYRPVLIGCLDPKILALIKERAIVFKLTTPTAWQLTTLGQDSTIGVLSKQ